ncbi:eclosion hormone-like [Oratosquilla oratoria]|uniref:eclosion hormone-like n=1 Tax=Oratosquilla oratoria TaxID=337810 RepID=UPI003F76A017
MTSTRKSLASVLMGLALLLLWGEITLVPGVHARAAHKISLCIQSCADCKEMYHDHFKGGLCADVCIHTEGRLALDCARNDTLLSLFLERLE